ncbi:hypothetical protein [Lawsonibacter sp. JLR.KK007]|jgi:hypothetical protein|uniref:hypothetical protein n=1 Tax=Lawsonibacter sp. JLR.KK007 TaxID=3114293 RepID=UPI002FF23314
MNSNTKDAAARRNPEPQPYGPQEVSFGLAELAIFVTCLEARDQDGVRTVVYLRDRGEVVSLDTCKDPELLTAAVAHLAQERDELDRTLAKAKRAKSQTIGILEKETAPGAANTEDGKAEME